MLTQWDRIKAVQRMQQHIEERLEEPITMASLARAAGYSRWHAARLFKELTGLAPFEYIRARRLSAAAERLQHGPVRVTDVAFDFVFDSHEGFTRAFSRHFGLPPSRLRDSGAEVELFLPPQLGDWYTRRQRGELEMSDSPQTVFVQVIDRPARRMIVRRGTQATHYFEYCDEVGCEVWDRLSAVEAAQREPEGLWLPQGLRPEGTSTYVQAVEVPLDYEGPLPEGMELMDMPAHKVMVFQGPPFQDAAFEQAISTLWDAINAYQPETCGFAWDDEAGPRFQLRPEGWRGYVEGRPVRAL